MDIPRWLLVIGIPRCSTSADVGGVVTPLWIGVDACDASEGLVCNLEVDCVAAEKLGPDLVAELGGEVQEGGGELGVWRASFGGAAVGPESPEAQRQVGHGMVERAFSCWDVSLL